MKQLKLQLKSRVSRPKHDRMQSRLPSDVDDKATNQRLINWLIPMLTWWPTKVQFPTWPLDGKFNWKQSSRLAEQKTYFQKQQSFMGMANPPLRLRECICHCDCKRFYLFNLAILLLNMTMLTRVQWIYGYRILLWPLQTSAVQSELDLCEGD